MELTPDEVMAGMTDKYRNYLLEQIWDAVGDDVFNYIETHLKPADVVRLSEKVPQFHDGIPMPSPEMDEATDLIQEYADVVLEQLFAPKEA